MKNAKLLGRKVNEHTDLFFDYTPLDSNSCMPKGVLVSILEEDYDITPYEHNEEEGVFVYANALGPGARDGGFVAWSDSGILLADAMGRNVSYDIKAAKQLYKALKALFE